LHASGAASDPYVRIDAADPRYFSLGGDLYWPNGPNLRSVNDARSKDRMRTRLTPDRGIAAYTAFLARAAAGGANAAEVWMSPWNLALEWRADWPGYYGQGRYNEVNAWKLDRVLDLAWERGMRINLVIHNHGQGSEGADHEWENSAYNIANGGRLKSAAQFFTDEWALAGQERLRRYLVARYADHPAVLGWKLWSEQDLTSGGDALAGWHQQAAKRWRELDSYDHPITSHWCGDFTHAKADVVASLDYVCIDAYHGQDRLITDLLESSTAGLAVHRKPTLVTEFGGNWDGAPSDAHMAMEHHCGPWAALVTGHAGAPMLWWFEWIDQHEEWSAYGAIVRFLAGEDLRGGTKVSLDAGSELWARAISRPGRLLGYLFDRNWARQPAAARARGGERFNVGGSIAAGAMTVEWWDADTGTATGSRRIEHPGGALNLTAPTWRRHLAFKLLRAR
nr:hypothetical protein [Planctomycetota bacterium]